MTVFNKHKSYQDLLAVGKNHLRTWSEYISNPLEGEKEHWHQSLIDVSLEEEYVDFSYLGKKYRLELKIHTEQRYGTLELNELVTDREDISKIKSILIEDMNVNFAINTTLSFENAYKLPETGELITIFMVEMKRIYAEEFDKCTVLRANHEEAMRQQRLSKNSE